MQYFSDETNRDRLVATTLEIRTLNIFIKDHSTILSIYSLLSTISKKNISLEPLVQDCRFKFKINYKGCNFHFRIKFIRPVSCYTLLNGFQLP